MLIYAYIFVKFYKNCEKQGIFALTFSVLET